MALASRTHASNGSPATPAIAERSRTVGGARIATLRPEGLAEDGSTPAAPSTGAEQLSVAPAPSVDAASGDYPEHFQGGLLLRDLRVCLLLANEARYRTLEQFLGISREQANLATLVAGLLLADAARNKAHQLLKAPGAPTLTDAVIGVGVLDGLVRAVGGSSARDNPMFTTLVGIAALGALARPAHHGIRRVAHRSRASVNRRYGRLIGRPRATGAVAQGRSGASARLDARPHRDAPSELGGDGCLG